MVDCFKTLAQLYKTTVDTSVVLRHRSLALKTSPLGVFLFLFPPGGSSLAFLLSIAESPDYSRFGST